MPNTSRSYLRILLLFTLVAVAMMVISGTVRAQQFPSTLSRAYPDSVQKLNSDYVLERASVLRELIIPVPLSCTGELKMRFDLPKEDYIFIVGKIFEKDLRTLTEKTKPEIWGYLSFLIGKYGMTQFADTVAAYGDEQNWRVQYSLIGILSFLRPPSGDLVIAQFLEADNPDVRREAFEALIRLRSKKATPMLISQLADAKAPNRYAALNRLAHIGAVEAAPAIGKLLINSDENNRYWAIDTLARLDAKSQAGALWQFLKESKNARQKGFAIAVLVQFEDKMALPLVLEDLKGFSSESPDKLAREHFAFEFISKNKPAFYLPELISLYRTKTRFLADPAAEKRLREKVLQLLYAYRSRAAISIYRENFPGGVPWDPNGYVARVLLEVDAREAVDDILAEFTRLAHSGFPGSDNDHGAGQLGIILAEFGERKTWKPLLDYLQHSKFYDRDRIFIELNKHVDPKFWKAAQNATPTTRKITSVRSAIEILSRESNIPIIVVDSPELEACPTEGMDKIESSTCFYVNPAVGVLQSLESLIGSFNSKQRGEYTFVFDEGTIRILKTKDAVGFWKTNILNKLS